MTADGVCKSALWMQRCGQASGWLIVATSATDATDTTDATIGTSARWNTVHLAKSMAFKRWLTDQVNRNPFKRRWDVLQANQLSTGAHFCGRYLMTLPATLKLGLK